MANRFICGWEDYNTLAGIQLEWLTTGTNPSITTGRRAATGALRHSSNGYSAKTVTPEGVTTLTAGFAVRFSNITTGPFFAFAHTTYEQFYLALNNDGTISAIRNGRETQWSTAYGTTLGTSTTVATANVWLPIEVQVTIHDSAGVVKVRFNGSAEDEIDLSGIDTHYDLAGATITRILLGSSWGLYDTSDFDDLWVNDTSGTDCTGFLGDMRVDSHYPTADGANTDWTPSTGTDHYAVIEETPADTADYISTDTLDAIDTFDVEAFKNDGADILAVQITMLAQKSDAGTCGIQAVVRESGTDTPSGNPLYPSTTWGYLQENYSLAEADAKRAAAGFDAAEYGLKKTA